MERATNTVSPRRLAAIAFVDLVGFSTLAHADEDKSLRMLERFRSVVREVLEASGGREIKSLGDGFLLEFAAARDGVHASLTIQQRLLELPEDESSPRPRARIGLHVGDVAIDGDDLLGDGVNLAARFEPLAPTGGVCVTEHVVHLLGSDPTLRFALLGKRNLKSIPGAVKVYRAYRSEEPTRGHRMDPVRFALKGRAPRIALLAVVVLASASLWSLGDLVGAVRQLPNAPSTEPYDYPWKFLAFLPLDAVGDGSLDRVRFDRINRTLESRMRKLTSKYSFLVRDTRGARDPDMDWPELGRKLRAGTILHGTIETADGNYEVKLMYTSAKTSTTEEYVITLPIGEGSESKLVDQMSELVDQMSEWWIGELIRLHLSGGLMPNLRPVTDASAPAVGVITPEERRRWER